MGSIRAIWAIQDRIALNTVEEKAIEVARIKAAIQTWDSNGVNTDRGWLEPVIKALFSEISHTQAHA